MTEALRATGAPLVYVLSAVAFFLGLKSVLKLRTATRGRPLIALGLGLAVLGGALEAGSKLLGGLVPFIVAAGVAGGVAARALSMTPVPARVAWIPGVAGGASALAAAALLTGRSTDQAPNVGAPLALLLGGAALVGGLILAFVRRETPRSNAAAALVVVAAGWSAALLGVALHNAILVMIGGVAGTAGFTLGRLMSAVAGRPLLALVFGGAPATTSDGYDNVRSCGTEEAAMLLETASNVVIIPGFGMAAAQAQHAVGELADLLRKKGARVTWAIHPSAGCVPGHMNIVLDEANVKHDGVLALAEAEPRLAEAEAVLVVGANDVVNPSSNDVTNAVYGLTAPDLGRARHVFVIKRSLRPGAVGVRNPLFEQANTTMIFGDAKKVAQALVAELKGGGH